MEILAPVLAAAPANWEQWSRVLWDVGEDAGSPQPSRSSAHKHKASRMQLFSLPSAVWPFPRSDLYGWAALLPMLQLNDCGGWSSRQMQRGSRESKTGDRQAPGRGVPHVLLCFQEGSFFASRIQLQQLDDALSRITVEESNNAPRISTPKLSHGFCPGLSCFSRIDQPGANLVTNDRVTRCQGGKVTWAACRERRNVKMLFVPDPTGPGDASCSRPRVLYGVCCKARGNDKGRGAFDECAPLALQPRCWGLRVMMGQADAMAAMQGMALLYAVAVAVVSV